MRSLNILIVPPHDLLTHPTPSRLYHMGKMLSRTHNVFLLRYPGHPLADPRHERTMGCTSVTFTPVTTKNLGMYYLLNAPGIYAALSHLMKKVGIDLIIHANIVPSYIALKLAETHGIPVICDYHDHLPESVASYYTNPLVSRIAHALVFDLVKRNIRMSDHVITNSRTLRNTIRSAVALDDEEISVIPNGFDVDLFNPMPREEARKAIGVQASSHLLLYYGSIDVWVDFEALMKLVNRIRGVYDRTLLMIVGLSHNSSMRADLDRLVGKYRLRENVLLLPPQPHEKVPEFVNAADIVIAPYKNVLKNYVVPLKILESLACGRPVITANISEYKTWFEGMPVVYYDTQEELERETIELIRSYEARKPELVRASQEIRDRFSWEKTAMQYEEVLKGLCK